MRLSTDCCVCFVFPDSSVPPSPTSPTAPIPDLVSGLPMQVAAAVQVVRATASEGHPAVLTALAGHHEEQTEQPPRASVAVRSRTRKPRSSPRKARSPRGARGKRAHTATSPAKGKRGTLYTAPHVTPYVTYLDRVMTHETVALTLLVSVTELTRTPSTRAPKATPTVC